MKHTNNYKKVSTVPEAVDFLTSLGYHESEKTELQKLGYTDGSLGFTKDDLFASCSPSKYGGINILY